MPRASSLLVLVLVMLLPGYGESADEPAPLDFPEPIEIEPETLPLELEPPDPPEAEPLLGTEDLARAEGQLYPHFALIHDLELNPHHELAQVLSRNATDLEGLIDEPVNLSVMVTNDPDADAGCLAGGRLYMSRGLISRMEQPQELQAIMALALTACQAADQAWSDRDTAPLAELDPDNPLMRRYRDYRLQSTRALYNQLVATGCGSGVDCRTRAAGWLESLGAFPGALDVILGRVESEWSDAPVLTRFGRGQGTMEPVGVNERFVELLDAIISEREAMDHLRVARNALLTGELITGLRATTRAGQTSHNPWLVAVYQTRLNLANLRPEFALRSLTQTLQHRPGYPFASYYEGIALLQMDQPERGMERLTSSLAVLPTVSAHYSLGVAHERNDNRALARSHFQAAQAGGDLHPQGRGAAARLAALDN